MESQELINENQELRAALDCQKKVNQDLTMRMVGAKMLLSKVTPVCSQKLEKLMTECGGCDDADSSD